MDLDFLAAGASLLGGLLSNKSSADRAEEAAEFNAEQAQINRDWQERMSNTAHQREVKDLRLAGLNPILSAGGKGAVTGSGSSASMQAIPATDVLSPAVSSALQTSRLGQELDNMAAVERNTRAQTENTNADTALKMVDYNVRKQDELLRMNQAEHELRKMGLTEAQIEKTLEEIKKVKADTNVSVSQVPLIKAQTAFQSSSARSAATKADLDARLSEAERIIQMGEGATSAIRNSLPGLNLFRKK